MLERTRVAIVEDHALTRAGLRTSLSADFEIVGEAADGIAGLELIVKARPSVAVIDIGLPGIDGIELTRRVRAQVPETHVVIVTMVDLEEEVVAALAAGADAYSLKSAEPERLIEAIRIVAEGGAYFDPGVAHVVLARFGAGPHAGAISPLSPRETVVLRQIAEGQSNAEIAKSLHLGLGTVKGHVRDIMEKLAAADRTQAAVVAMRRGYI
jgi:DNA-binding NarL/FixJ family response regulator